MQNKATIRALLVFIACLCLSGVVLAEENYIPGTIPDSACGDIPSTCPIVDFGVTADVDNLLGIAYIDVYADEGSEPGSVALTDTITLSVKINGEEVYNDRVSCLPTVERMKVYIYDYMVPGENLLEISIDSSDLNYCDLNPENDHYEYTFTPAVGSFPRDMILDGYMSDQEYSAIIEIYSADGSDIEEVKVVVVYAQMIVYEQDCPVIDGKVVIPLRELSFYDEIESLYVNIYEVEDSVFRDVNTENNQVIINDIIYHDPDCPDVTIGSMEYSHSTGDLYISVDLGSISPMCPDIVTTVNNSEVDRRPMIMDYGLTYYQIPISEYLIFGENEIKVFIVCPGADLDSYCYRDSMTVVYSGTDYALEVTAEGTIVSGIVTGEADVPDGYPQINNFELRVENSMTDEVYINEIIGRDFSFDLFDQIPSGQTNVIASISVSGIDELDYSNNKVQLLLEKGKPKDLNFSLAHLGYVYADYVIGYVGDASGEDSPFFWFNCSMWLESIEGEITPLVSQEIATDCTDSYSFRASLRDMNIAPGSYTLCGQVDFMPISGLYDPDLSNNQAAMDIVVYRNLGIGYFEYDSDNESLVVYIDGDGGVAKEVTLFVSTEDGEFYEEYFASMEVPCNIEIPISEIEAGTHEVTVEVYTPYDDVEDENPAPLMTREIEIAEPLSVMDLVIFTGVWNYPRTLYIDSYASGAPGIMDPEGPEFYSVFFNGEELFSGECYENWMSIDIRKKIVSGWNYFSAEVSKDDIYDPRPENNFVERSFYVETGSVSQDIAVDTFYNENADTLVVDVIPGPGQTFSPDVYHVDVVIGTDSFLSADYSMDQGCIIEDLSSYLGPGYNEITATVSYVVDSPYYDPDESNNMEILSVVGPATDTSIAYLQIEKSEFGQGEIVSQIEGDSSKAEELVIEVYDRKGVVIYTDTLYDVELPCTVSVPLSDLSGRWYLSKYITFQAYIPGEENMEENIEIIEIRTILRTIF